VRGDVCSSSSSSSSSSTFEFEQGIAHAADLEISSDRDVGRITKVQHRQPLSISCTPSMFDSFASSLSTTVSLE